VAVGPGHYPIKYNGPKGKRTKSWRSKRFQPCDIQVGDIIDLGGLERQGYLFPTVRWGAKEVVVCREADVTLVGDELPDGYERETPKRWDDLDLLDHAETVNG